MKVKVKYFAVLHEELDRDEEEMVLPEGATVKVILDRLEAEWPEIAEYYDVMQTSVNWSMPHRIANFQMAMRSPSFRR